CGIPSTVTTVATSPACAGGGDGGTGATALVASCAADSVTVCMSVPVTVRCHRTLRRQPPRGCTARYARPRTWICPRPQFSPTRKLPASEQSSIQEIDGRSSYAPPRREPVRRRPAAGAPHGRHCVHVRRLHGGRAI